MDAYMNAYVMTAEEQERFDELNSLASVMEGENVNLIYQNGLIRKAIVAIIEMSRDE